MLPAPLTIGKPKSMYLPLLNSRLTNLVHLHPLVRSAALSDSLIEEWVVKFWCAMHVKYVSHTNSLHGVVTALLLHAHLAPLGIGNPKSTYPLFLAICLLSLVQVRPLVWPTASSYSPMHWIRFKVLHMQHAPQVTFLHRAFRFFSRANQCIEYEAVGP